MLRKKLKKQAVDVDVEALNLTQSTIFETGLLAHVWGTWSTLE
jgi:hypothetical protein